MRVADTTALMPSEAAGLRAGVEDEGQVDPLAGSPYRALRSIGSGATGEVFEAIHVQLGKPVVVKLLRGGLVDATGFVDRMRIEAQIAARIRHPNLTEVLDVGCGAGGRPFVVMERLAGRTLRDELTLRGEFRPKEALDVVRQLLAGLSAVHRVGIVHRDIKLDNLFLCDPVDGKRVLKILDFGIAKVLPSAAANAPAPLAVRTAEGVTIGTPRFLSPEQALGEPVDERSDLYAAGVVLYTLLAGQDPFSHWKDAFDLLQAHVNEAPGPPSRVAAQRFHPALDAIVLKALSKQPADRYASADEFQAALERVGDGAPPYSTATAQLDPAELARAIAAGGSPGTSVPVAPELTRTSHHEGAPATWRSGPGVSLPVAIALLAASALVSAVVAAIVGRWLFF